MRSFTERERTENTYNKDKHGIRDFMQSSVDLQFFCIWDTSLLWYEKAPADIMALFFLVTKQTQDPCGRRKTCGGPWCQWLWCKVLHV